MYCSERTCLNQDTLKFMCSVPDCNSPNECQFTTNIPWTSSSEAENRQKYKTITQKSCFLLSSLPNCLCIKNDVPNKVLIWFDLNGNRALNAHSISFQKRLNILQKVILSQVIQGSPCTSAYPTPNPSTSLHHFPTGSVSV